MHYVKKESETSSRKPEGNPGKGIVKTEKRPEKERAKERRRRGTVETKGYKTQVKEE